MWAISWETTSATRSSSRRDALSGVDEQDGFSERDATQVLHRPEGKIGDGEEVELLTRVPDPEPSGEELEGVRGGLQCETGERILARDVHDAYLDAIHVDRICGDEWSDDERDQVARHRDRVREADAPGASFER